MKLEKMITLLEEIAPSDTQESWDNSGVQLAAGPLEIRKVLLTLEITDAVIEEAAEENADMIITHHPLIFAGIKTVDYRNVIGSYIVKLLNMGISVYSCHTPFDKLAGGNNDFLAELIGLQDVEGFCADGTVDMIGRVGTLAKPMTLEAMHKFLAKKLKLKQSQIRAVGKGDMSIQKVGICTGAGADLMRLAMENGCQLFITGDVKYHEAQDAAAHGLALLDAGHYGTEKSFAANFAKKLAEKTDGKIEILESNVDIDPFKMV